MVKKQDAIPAWVSDEIKNAKFGKPKLVVNSGYILEIYDKDNKIDAQLYEPIEDGRHIVTLDLPKNIKLNDLQKGVTYEFVFNLLKAPLDKKVVEYLKTEKEFDMDAIYQFELQKIKLIDKSDSESTVEE
jgi:hypothetical protein|tara:strand:+ start:115 stop:504 length:390 start_codon:yes stop_codon:yes gene_type:complete